MVGTVVSLPATYFSFKKKLGRKRRFLSLIHLISSCLLQRKKTQEKRQEHLTSKAQHPLSWAVAGTPSSLFPPFPSPQVLLTLFSSRRGTDGGRPFPSTAAPPLTRDGTPELSLLYFSIHFPFFSFQTLNSHPLSSPFCPPCRLLLFLFPTPAFPLPLQPPSNSCFTTSLWACACRSRVRLVRSQSPAPVPVASPDTHSRSGRDSHQDPAPPLQLTDPSFYYVRRYSEMT